MIRVRNTTLSQFNLDAFIAAVAKAANVDRSQVEVMNVSGVSGRRLLSIPSITSTRPQHNINMDFIIHLVVFEASSVNQEVIHHHLIIESQQKNVLLQKREHHTQHNKDFNINFFITWEPAHELWVQPLITQSLIFD